MINAHRTVSASGKSSSQASDISAPHAQIPCGSLALYLLRALLCSSLFFFGNRGATNNAMSAVRVNQYGKAVSWSDKQ